MSKYLITIFQTLLLSAAIWAQPKGSLFIIGGGKRPVELVQFMIDKSGLDKSDYITILPWASEEPDSSSFYAKKKFQELGYERFFDIQPSILKHWSEDLSEKLIYSKLIYIPGGDQRRFMEIAVEYNFDSLLAVAYENGAMIAGTSAGAAIMSKPMITGTALKSEEYYPTFRTLETDNLELEEGIGLLPEHIIIDQHFIWRSRYNRLLTAIMENPKWTGWGIEESTAAYVSGNKVEVIGKYQIIVFRNIRGKSNTKNGLLGAENIQLSIYLPGEKFDLTK